MIDECLASDLGPVYVVLGAYMQLIEEKIKDRNIYIIENLEHQNGLGTSISCGINQIKKEYIAGAIISIVDQPYFNRDILKQLANQGLKSKAPIITCRYENGFGPPSFFRNDILAELVDLGGQQGAKSLIKKYWDSVDFIDFKRGMIDIDTPEDLDVLSNFKD